MARTWRPVTQPEADEMQRLATKGLTQREIGKKLNRPHGTVGHVLAGKWKPKAIRPVEQPAEECTGCLAVRALVRERREKTPAECPVCHEMVTK